MFKVLVPVDGSEESVAAARLAVNIADKFKGEVYLLHVIKPSAGDYSGVNFMGYQLPEDLYNQVADEWYKVGNQMLESVNKQIESDQVKINMQVAKGDPATTICDIAEKGKYNLICMGNRGLGGFSGMIGSVSSRVIQNASCPVVINH